MSEWKLVGKIDELTRELETSGFLKELELENCKIVLSYQDGEFGALNNKCNHMGRPLSKGKLKKGCIESGQWAANGSDISYSGGNVGIGTSNATAKLDIYSGSFKVRDGTRGALIAHDSDDGGRSYLVLDSNESNGIGVEDGYLDLNVDPIHWAVVNAIKDLYHRWFDDSQEVRRELASVKAENAAKDQEIRAIKAYLCEKDPKASLCH